MQPRTLTILEAVIREFIETGEPISSKSLSKKCDFGVKDATIRNELNYLMQEGLLDQPHTSGGRVPTDKGYRFLVDQILGEIIGDDDFETDKGFNVLKAEFARGDFDDFVGDLAGELEVLGVGYVSRGALYKSGLAGLFSHLVADQGINDPREMFQVVQDFELIDEKIGDLLDFLTEKNTPQVWIGKSPITKSRELSVIADQYETRGRRFVLAAVGPKRMNYEHNLKFLKNLRRILTAN